MLLKLIFQLPLLHLKALDGNALVEGLSSCFSSQFLLPVKDGHGNNLSLTCLVNFKQCSRWQMLCSSIYEEFNKVVLTCLLYLLELVCFSKFTETLNNLKLWLIPNSLYLALDLIIITIINSIISSGNSNLELIVMLDFVADFLF